VRFLARVQNARGNLKMCAVSPKISEVLKITKLNTIFDAYESETEAIAGFYRRPKSSDRPLLAANILCVEKSADVLAYVRELLRQAGYADHRRVGQASNGLNSDRGEWFRSGAVDAMKRAA
jgi:hypothetical protein